MTLEVCRICGSFIVNRKTLCSVCNYQFSLRAKTDGLILRSSPFQIHSLWSWDDDTDEISRSLIYAMKKCSDADRWKYFAGAMLAMLPPSSGSACLVPIPSKTSAGVNHAMGLALAFSQMTGYPVEDCLVVQSAKGHQRRLSRLQRRHIQIHKRKRLKAFYEHLILIDDVITSGATLAAAYKALNRPPSISAWCLMDRRLVALADDRCYKERQC